MPTKEDVFRLGDTISRNITTIGKTIQENKLKERTKKVLSRLDAKNPDSVNSTVLFLNQTGQQDAANSVKNWYVENERIADRNKKEGMFNALNQFNYTGLTRKDDYRVGAGDEDAATHDPFNPQVTYPTASEPQSPTEDKFSTIKESGAYTKGGKWYKDRFRSTGKGLYEIVETVEVNDPNATKNTHFSGSTTTNNVSKQLIVGDDGMYEWTPGQGMKKVSDKNFQNRGTESDREQRRKERQRNEDIQTPF